MRLKALFVTVICISILTVSCIKKEGPDREADIISISIDDPDFTGAKIDDAIARITLQIDGDITKYRKGEITPTIEVSSGAQVSPKSLEPAELDENCERTYIVTAEDGGVRTYTLRVVNEFDASNDFEDWVSSSDNKYELPGDPMWTNANPGIVVIFDRYIFPTRKGTDIYPESDGKFSLILETLEGNKNSQSNMMNIPVFAGNYFRGEFDISKAFVDPLLTTRFGQTISKNQGKPIALVAHYKYKSGSPFITWEYKDPNAKEKDKIKVIEELPDKKDKPDIYAILFKVAKGEAGRDEVLTAYDIKTSDKIVATALMEDQSEKLSWTKLQTKFTYKEELDFEKNDYKLTVVLTSSTDGANYKGAIGSILTVDDLRIVYATDDDAEEFL